MKNNSKRSSITALLPIIIFLFSISTGFGQTKTEQFDKVLNLYQEYGLFNGSVLISENGKTIYKKGFGLANMEWNIPNESDTKHRLGSITKQFTAMLILQLADDKILDLHKPITNYLPDYPKVNGDEVTVHHLLTHSSGIPNYTSFPKFFEDISRKPFTPDEFLEVFANKELEFTPGEKFSYSNSGYFLLGAIAEKLTGKSYEQLLKDKILTPIGMTNSGFDNHSDILAKRATGYEKNGSSYINSSYLDMSIPYAAGSMYSTVEDLYLWDQALYTNKLLTKKMMELYFAPHISTQGDNHYAYGWGVREESIGNTEETVSTLEHGGGINGFNTNITRATKDKTLVVLLNNTGGAPLNEITRALRGIMYGKSYDLPKKSVSSAVLATIQEKGIESGISHFQKIKNDASFSLDESDMNAIGYQLMSSGKTEEALEVFRLNVGEFPDSFNAYDSYAEAYMKLGQNESAIANYKKSIDLNPGNNNGIEMLKKLGEDVSNLIETIEIPDNILASYVGQYELMPSFILTITKKGTQLKAQATGQSAFEIYPKSNTEFYLKVVEASITFKTTENGSVESLTLFQGGQEIIGKRLP